MSASICLLPLLNPAATGRRKPTSQLQANSDPADMLYPWPASTLCRFACLRQCLPIRHPPFIVRLLTAGLLAVAFVAPAHAAPLDFLKSKQPAKPASAKNQEKEREISKWAINEALVEWQVARLAAACNEVATAGSPTARREALRFKAAYATSSYAILSGRSPLVQTLDLVAMSKLTHEVWIEDGRAATEFGDHARSVTTAIRDITKRIRLHARSCLSGQELEAVEEMVLAWRKAHPGPVVVEFIRFEAFADEIAASRGKTADLGGMFGRIEGEASNVAYLGERALALTSRMPRLAEWHAEAAAANMLAQQDLATALTSIRQLGDLQRDLPEQLKLLDDHIAALPEQLKLLDDHIAALPMDLVGAATTQPELKEALAKTVQTMSRLESMETSILSLERSVTELGDHLGQLNLTTHPESLRKLADDTGGMVSSQGRALILLATACMAGLLLLHALLRRIGSATARSQ